MAKEFSTFLLILPMLLFFSCIEDSGGPSISSKISQYISGDPVEEPQENEEEEISIVRPQGLTINSDFCSCLNGKADSMGNCASFCQSRSTNEATLFLTFTLGADIEFNSDGINSLKSWCETPINGSTASPSCLLKLVDPLGSERTLPVSITGTKNANVVVSELDFNKTYTMSLIISGEPSSYSDSKHFRRMSEVVSEVDSTILKVTPIYKYKCMQTSVDTSTNETVHALYQHFYYRPSSAPSPIPASNTTIYCHDIIKYGKRDASSYPRLDLDPTALYLWDMSDTRFSNLYNSTATILDIHEYISLLLEEEYSYVLAPTGINYFQELRWPNSILDESNPSPMLGYYLQASYDSVTKLSYCPKQIDFNTSTDEREKVLKSFIGVDTEGLYWAKRDPENLIDPDGTIEESPVVDVMIVKESDVKKVWFYFNNGTPVEPNDLTIQQNTIYFYYPYNFDNPYVKLPSQKIYKISSAEELSGTTDVTMSQSRQSHDKRFGCAPKMITE